MTEPKFNEQTTEGSAIPVFDQADIEKNKTMAGLAYLLFFLPLVACPDSPFGRFHANQGTWSIWLQIRIQLLWKWIRLRGKKAAAYFLRFISEAAASCWLSCVIVIRPSL
jgi:hypothetical protein